jgi:hypothetical protein
MPIKYNYIKAKYRTIVTFNNKHGGSNQLVRDKVKMNNIAIRSLII